MTQKEKCHDAVGLKAELCHLSPESTTLGYQPNCALKTTQASSEKNRSADKSSQSSTPPPRPPKGGSGASNCTAAKK